MSWNTAKTYLHELYIHMYLQSLCNLFRKRSNCCILLFNAEFAGSNSASTLLRHFALISCTKLIPHGLNVCIIYMHTGSQINKHRISLRFLGIILRIHRLEVSIYNVCLTNQFQTTFAQEGRGSEIR